MESRAKYIGIETLLVYLIIAMPYGNVDFSPVLCKYGRGVCLRLLRDTATTIIR